MTDGIDLGCVSTTSDSDADVDIGEFLETDDEEGFVDLESKDLRLNEVEGLSVDLYKSFSRLYDPSRQYFAIFFLMEEMEVQRTPAPKMRRKKDCTYTSESDGGRSLFLAEALNTLC